jgi:hypothetical protein
MNVGLEIDKSGQRKYRYNKCDNDPQYIAENGRIKKGTTCACISVSDAGGSAYGYYCRGCINKIYADLKKFLIHNCGFLNERQLWIY